MTVEVTVLDGGLATALEERGHDLSDSLWSARLLADAPAEITATHLDFFRAGAQVATTASYQASFEGFAQSGYDRRQTTELLTESVRLAQRARDEYVAESDGRPAGEWLVAASVGPYGAMRADGSEYTGAYGVGDDVLREFHRPRLEVLAEADPDLLAIETIPSVQEAVVLLDLLAEMPASTRAWLSLTCADGRRTRRGEPVDQVFGLVRDEPRVVAVGVNCTAPEHVEELVAAAARCSGKPVVVYPNSGETWDPVARSWRSDGAQGFEPATVTGWVAAGARWVGGCCRVGPAAIAALATALGRSG